jgi:hypothetical protein
VLLLETMMQKLRRVLCAALALLLILSATTTGSAHARGQTGADRGGFSLSVERDTADVVTSKARHTDCSKLSAIDDGSGGSPVQTDHEPASEKPCDCLCFHGGLVVGAFQFEQPWGLGRSRLERGWFDYAAVYLEVNIPPIIRI